MAKGWLKHFFKSRSVLHFLCKHCNISFYQDVGAIDFEHDPPRFEHAVVCDCCGARYVGNGDEFSDNFELTEHGQSMITALMLGSAE